MHLRVCVFLNIRTTLGLLFGWFYFAWRLPVWIHILQSVENQCKCKVQSNTRRNRPICLVRLWNRCHMSLSFEKKGDVVLKVTHINLVNKEKITNSKPRIDNTQRWDDTLCGHYALNVHFRFSLCLFWFSNYHIQILALIYRFITNSSRFLKQIWCLMFIQRPKSEMRYRWVNLCFQMHRQISIRGSWI